MTHRTINSVAEWLKSPREERSMIPVNTIPLMLSIVCLVVPAWADDKVGEDAYDRGDYATAWHELQSLAAQ